MTNQTSEITPVVDLQRLMTFDELCELTQTKPSTMYHLLSEGNGPASIKIGRNLRFHPSHVQAWLDDLAQDRSVALKRA